MKTLTSLSTSAFAGCAINEFDAPHLDSITVDKDDYRNVTFIVDTKNFIDSPGII